MELLRYSICSIVLISLIILRQIHIIQLNSYNLDQQLIWYKKNWSSFLSNIVLLVSCILFYEFRFILAFYLIIVSMVMMLIENLPRRQKKKLVFTARIKRLIFVCVILFAIGFVVSILGTSGEGTKYILYITGFAPAIVFIGYLICLPIENGIRRKFMNEAHKIIHTNDNLYVIGITGSFGKTSVKHYLSKILREKYSVCMTPESFNTAMGATLTIKNDLRNIDDIFICEMGARRVRDIKEICDIVDPDGAIITDVGNMHLDTFKNIDNVCRTKFELVDAVQTNANTSGKSIKKKIILLNGDNELIRQKHINGNDIGSRICYYGLNDDNDFYADNITVNGNGTTFNFCSKEYGKETFETKLLGKYNIINLVAAIGYSLLLDVNMKDIKEAVRSIVPVPHRLQILPYGNNDILIDDAYNSNPKGAKNAIDVINSFDGYVKVLITPGMVELSDKQDMENEKFAEYAGKMVDYAVVVGNTNKHSLNAGFEKSMDKDKIRNFDRIENAINYVVTNIADKKVILLENDLSDNY